jgi:phosphoglycolate phosphatase
MTPRAGTIIFDLDGTLVDSVPDLANALDRLMVEEGLPKIGRKRARSLIGHGIRAFIRAAFSFHGMSVSAEREGQLVLRFKAIYANALADETTVYPGVADTLAALRAQGHCLGVCTNKDEVFARTILARLDLENFFVTVAGPDTFGFTKPDPRHLTATIGLIDPARPAVFVGDSEVDAETAIAAKVPVIVLTHGYCKVPHARLGADRLADSFAELPVMIRDLMAADRPMRQ